MGSAWWSGSRNLWWTPVFRSGTGIFSGDYVGEDIIYYICEDIYCKKCSVGVFFECITNIYLNNTTTGYRLIQHLDYRMDLLKRDVSTICLSLPSTCSNNVSWGLTIVIQYLSTERWFTMIYKINYGLGV